MTTAPLDRLRPHLPLALAASFAACIALAGLASFGVWDPWEIRSTEAAGDRFDVATARHAPLGTWLVSAGLEAFGQREWAGRAPIALFGLAAALLAFALLARFGDRKTGAYAALVTVTTPLFVLNARQMVGEAPAFACQALVAWAAAETALRREAPIAKTIAWLAAAVAGCVLATLAAGTLMGVLPPLVAVAAVAVLHDRLRDRDKVGPIAVVAIAGVAVALVARAVATDAAEYTHLLGGRPSGGQPPTFEDGLELVFHAFTPWSALLVPAIGFALRAADDDDSAGEAPAVRREAAAIGLVLVLWAALAYGLETLYRARYGATTYLAPVALAGLVALLLRTIEERGGAERTVAAIAILMAGLLLRDAALYPGSPMQGLPYDDLRVPDVFRPTKEWAIAIGVFVLALVASLGVERRESRLDFAAPYRWVVEQWRRGLAPKIWLGGLGVLLAAVTLGGLAAWTFGVALPLPLLVLNVLKYAMLGLVAGAPLFVVGAQLFVFGASRLGRFRVVPLLVAGAAIGAWLAFGYLPALSAHFSPREVYDTYNALRGPDDQLGDYHIGARAAKYYAHDVVEIEGGQDAIVAYLDADGRRWAVVPGDDFAAIDQRFRQQAGRHLVVADRTNARVFLVTNRPIENRADDNPIARYVRREVPTVQHPVGARFGQQIELVGYDLDLPEGEYVGAGQTFRVTWVWKVIGRVAGGYQIFLHVDGAGQRLNGDHQPLDGAYPLRLWEPGDVILDEQELRVPGNFRPGEYTFFIGFFAGESRLPVTEGPNDGQNRLRAGSFTVR